MALVGVFGFFILSQSTSSGITQAPSMDEVNDDEVVYRLATSDDPNALPRLAVILKSEVNHTITAIDGITVVGLSSGAVFKESLTDYTVLKEDFDLDYIITAKMLPYGEAFKLNVSLIDVEGGNVLFNEPFDLDISVKMPRSWQNYDFYKKYEEASEFAARRDYESTKKSVELFREVIAEEPTYVPAYFGLYHQLSWQRGYYTLK